MGIDLKKLKKLLPLSPDQLPGFFDDFFYYKYFLFPSFAHYLFGFFYKRSSFTLMVLSDSSYGSFEKMKLENFSKTESFNFCIFAEKQQKSVFVLFILKLRQYVAFLKSSTTKFSLSRGKNIFARLSEKTNLLFRLDNNTGLSLPEALHTTTTI